MLSLGGPAGDSSGVDHWTRRFVAATVLALAAVVGCGGAENSNRSMTGVPDGADGHAEADGSSGAGGPGTDGAAAPPGDATAAMDASQLDTDGSQAADSPTASSDSAALADTSTPGTESGEDAEPDGSAGTGAPSVFSGTDTYAVVNVRSGQALNVSNGGTIEGSPVVASTAENTTSEQWTFLYAGNGLYTVQGVGSGLLLEMDGTSVEIDTATNASNQQWSVVEASPGEYRITPESAASSCAAPSASSGATDTTVVVATYTEDPGQLWLFEAVTPGDAGHICTGTPAACGTLTTESACNTSDCTWSGSACSGSPLPCSWHTGSADDCQAAGCE